MTYEIGYRRPPASGQFKKGTSGNAKGRPKGSRNFVTLLDDELNQSIVVNENGKKKKITRLQAMVKRLVSNALNGDPKSMVHLFEILKRSGQLTTPEKTEDFLPEDHEALLQAFFDKRQKAPRRPESTTSTED